MRDIPHSGYGKVHRPLVVVPEPGAKKNQTITHVGKLLGFFDETNDYPPIDIPVEVMIKYPLFAKHDKDLIIGLRLKVVDPDRHELIAISGFERNGFTGATTATGFSVDGAERRHYSKREVDRWPAHSLNDFIYTPGRSRIVVVDNASADRLNDGSRKPLIPTNVYVKRRHEAVQAPHRIEGLSSLEDADYFDLIKDKLGEIAGGK